MSSSIPKKQISKNSSPSPNPRSNSNNKSLQNKSLSKNKDLSLPHFNTLDKSFLSTMEQLVSNDKTIREKAAQKVRQYLHISYSNSEEIYQKITRSLFYFFWNTDKPTYQLSMAKIIASFIFINPDDKNKLIPKNRLWISTFLSEMSKKFQNIDSLRLDKYIMMIDQVMSTYLSACLENKFFKSVIHLINYFIKESENNNIFNFTFEANKIKVISRFVKLILNSDDKIEGNIKNKDDFLNNEESGFATFYKKLLIFYKNMKDKRQIKNFQDNILEIVINSLLENKRQNKNLNLIKKIEEINENFMKENKNDISGNKNLNIKIFLNKLKNEKIEPNIAEINKNKNVVDPVNDYIMKKKYLQKFKKSKEDIKKERLEKLEKEKNKNLNKEENIEKNKNDEDIINKEKSDKKKKSDKKDKLDKLKNISDELNFDDIEVEKYIIDLNEEDEEKKVINIKKSEDESITEAKLSGSTKKVKEKEEENVNKNKKETSNKKDSNNKKDNSNKKDTSNKKEMIEIKEKEANKENKSLTKNNKADNKSPKLLQKNSSSGDDDCLIEDSDESDEELIEENDDDDSSENPSSSNNTNSKERNKSPMGEFYTDEVLDRYSKELMEEEEEEEENDEDYEIDENDLDILANDMNLNSLGENYNEQKTLMNTKLNMKQNMLNKKTMRNIINEMNNFKNKNKKKKITFSLENNVVSLYNSKIPITLKSKKKVVFVPGGSNRQSILKK